jgi:hypothetical protein
VIAVLNAAEGQNRSELSVLLCDTLRTLLVRGEEPPVALEREFFDGHLILTSPCALVSRARTFKGPGTGCRGQCVAVEALDGGENSTRNMLAESRQQLLAHTIGRDLRVITIQDLQLAPDFNT